MPENTKTYEFNTLERNWIRKSLETQRQALHRSMQKEMNGSEVRTYRQREIEQLNAILARF